MLLLDRYTLFVSYPFALASANKSACKMKPERETACKSDVKIVRVPRHPIMPIFDIWIRVVPSPVEIIHADYVVRYINKH